MYISDDDTRIDILKIDMSGGAERLALYEILDAGFRPAVIMIRWAEEPDSHPGVRVAAGNLQNCGYVLVKKEAQKYLYCYVDNDMYATCSWELEGVVNPMVDTVVQEVLSQVNSAPSPKVVADENVVDVNTVLNTDAC